MFPLPVKYRLHFGRPIWLAGGLEPRNVAHGVDHVRRVMTEMIARGLEQRRRIFA